MSKSALRLVSRAVTSASVATGLGLVLALACLATTTQSQPLSTSTTERVLSTAPEKNAGVPRVDEGTPARAERIQAQVSPVTSPTLELAWTSAEADRTRSVAWADWDNDGDLDLAVGNGGDLTIVGFVSVRVYRNTGGGLELAWSSTETNDTKGLAWGDWDNDGDLDLAVVGWETPSRVYANYGGRLEVAWTQPGAEKGWGTCVAWGDWDSDGDLDLALGNGGDSGQGRLQIYRNTGGSLALAWTSPFSGNINSIAWSDWDKDGDLDLAVGNGGPSHESDWGGSYYSDNWILANRGGYFERVSSFDQAHLTRSVAWGDWDGDGDPDLALGESAEGVDAWIWGYPPAYVYSNSGGSLSQSWSSAEYHDAQSVAWGDWDSDGDLDLAVGPGGGEDPFLGSGGQPARVYANVGGNLTLAWSSPYQDATSSAAWGDWDNDGDLDLAVGNSINNGVNRPNRVYRNTGQRLTEVEPAPFEAGTDLAWGDMDGDGDLDLAVAADDRPSRVYRNNGSVLELLWTTPMTETTEAVAWGDLDGDGDLDLATGNRGTPSRVYRNQGSSLELDWTAPLTATLGDAAWGDWDNDGDLDLAVSPGRVYENTCGILQLAWSAPTTGGGHVAWGDWEGDGDLDLALGAHIYANLAGQLELAWSAREENEADDVAWGDFDRDGDLDLAVANGAQPNRVYRTVGQTMELAWSGQGMEITGELAWGDVDGDGDLDLAAGNGSDFFWGAVPSRVYLNQGGSFGTPITLPNGGTHLAWADYDGDGDLDLAVGGRLYQNHTADNPVVPDRPTQARISQPGGAAAPFMASTKILEGSRLTISYVLADPEGHAARMVKAYYSLDGGSHWSPAVAATGTVTTNLASAVTGSAHTYVWDIGASGVFGYTDSAIFRLDVYQGYGGAGPYQYAFRSAQTLPFRLRGSQVRVMSKNGPATGAVIYRQPVGQAASYDPMMDLFGKPLRTDSAGFLPGRGALNPGDGLVALVPVTSTESFTLYHTNARPTETGIEAYRVASTGVQTLTVSSSMPLVLFDLDISLEWDARYDPPFLNQFRFNLQRTSEILYDWTDGQAALGRVRVFLAGEEWLDANVRIYASNRVHPSAAQDGIVTEFVTDTANTQLNYAPGQVHMGAVWNRYGDPGGSVNEDWSRTLAHELGHYLLYLDDNYLGMDSHGALIPVDTCGGAMADPYRDDYSEFHPDGGWLPSCQATLSNLRSGRSDWSTVANFYPWLSTPDINPAGVNPGPSRWPLAATQIEVSEPVTASTSLDVPVFYLTRAEGERYQPSSTARAYLFQDERLVDLGQATIDQVLARGAFVGDRLCVFEPATARSGCEVIRPGDEQLALVARPDWQPVVDISPVTSRTIHVEVSQAAPGLTLVAQLYPADSGASEPLTLTARAASYGGDLTAPDPAFEGYVDIWVAEAAPRREVVADYAIGGNPGHRRSSGGHRRSSGGHRRSSGAPVLSSDGEVIIYVDDSTFAENQFYVVQTATSIPAPPSWATVVGQGYRLAASAGAPSLVGAQMSFAYFGRDVPAGEENWLQVYFWDGTSWQRLPTTLDTYYNRASTTTRGPGLYALMSSVEIPLYGPGWDLFTYPVPEARPVITALQSISGTYATLHIYDQTLSDPFARWQTFSLQWPAVFNTLHQLEYGRDYWINLTASEPITLYLKGASAANTAGVVALQLPPATYYGSVGDGPGFTARAGMVVQARIGSHLCGQAQTRLVGTEVMYAINVLADGAGVATGCGAPGRTVAFQVGGTALPVFIEWNTERVWHVLLSPIPGGDVYLPLIRK